MNWITRKLTQRAKTWLSTPLILTKNDPYLTDFYCFFIAFQGSTTYYTFKEDKMQAFPKDTIDNFVTASRDQIEQLQFTRLRWALQHGLCTFGDVSKKV